MATSLPVDGPFDSVNTCHLSNIALRLKREIHWDAAKQTIKDDEIANAMLARESRKGYEIEV